jgi:arylsulfatase A-like enzyme
VKFPAASLVILCCLGFGEGNFLAHAAEADSPNIVVIFADDMGFSDLGCYGGEIKTPNLDRLAVEGMRFSQFYNCALCGPSRAALMTGLHPHQVGISNWTGLLNNRRVTVFELLKRAGYATCAVGRLDMVTAENWHEPANIARHVDRFFGSTGYQGPGNFFKDVRNNAFYRDGKPYSIPEGGYKTDLITDFAVEFIGAADKSKPLFLYMSHYAPHWPLHAKPEDIAKYRDLYRGLGWDKAREQRLERLLADGLLPAGTRLAPRDSRAPAWETAMSKVWEAERMAVYAAQIDCLDQSVGRVMDALRSSGRDQQTLIFFLSDNGASDMAVGQLDKPNETWRVDGTLTRVGNRPDIQPGPADTFVTAGPAWSCVANTPFREHKNTNYEGGIASPLVVWWPKVLRAGSMSGELSHIVDIPATVLDVAGATYPNSFDNRRVTPLAGKSLLPVLRGGSREGHATLCWNTSGSRAVREGDWKLVARKDGPWQLYDLGKDRTELDNLAESHPERVARLAKIFAEWRAE